MLLQIWNCYTSTSRAGLKAEHPERHKFPGRLHVHLPYLSKIRMRKLLLQVILHTGRHSHILFLYIYAGFSLYGWKLLFSAYTKISNFDPINLTVFLISLFFKRIRLNGPNLRKPEFKSKYGKKQRFSLFAPQHCSAPYTATMAWFRYCKETITYKT